MRVLIIASQSHKKALAYAAHRNEGGDEVCFGAADTIDDTINEIIIPAEDPDVQELAAALKADGKRVTILGADA